MIALFLSAFAASGLSLVRDALPVQDEVFLHVEIVPFEGRLFADPNGDPVSAPPLPDLDWQAASEAAYDVAAVRLSDMGIAQIVGSGASTSREVGAPLPMSFLPTVPDRTRVVVVRAHIGWCPDAGAFRLCVRAPDASLGQGDPSVWAGIGRIRQGRRGPRWTQAGALYAQYRYAWLADGIGGDQPVVGRGETPETQVNTALAMVMRAVVDRLVTRKARRSAAGPEHTVDGMP